jgi:hypothetical protein
MVSELLNNLNENAIAYAIVCALSAWLGKVWASRIARSEDVKLQRELTQLRDKLESSQKLLAGEVEKKVHVHKVQFEKEFLIYQELMRHANGVRARFFRLYHTVQPTFPTPEEGNKYYENLRKGFVEAWESLRCTIDDNKPFYTETVHASCHGITELSIDQLIDMMAPETDFLRRREEIKRMKEGFVQAVDAIATAIRVRLNSITVVE